MMIYAEVAGIADTEGPDNERLWAKLLEEKQIPIPGSHGRASVIKSKIKEEA